MLKALMAMAVLFGPALQARPVSRYAEGQVWEYRTRPGEERSLLKIQQVERLPDFEAQGPVNHISVIGVRFSHGASEIQHLPVSGQTLDASVTRLSGSTDPFPSPAEGMAIWREAQGGVFDIPVAQIIDVAEQAMRQQGERQQGQPAPAPSS